MRYDSVAAWQVEDTLRLMWKRGYRIEREILILYYPKGITQDEIASMLETSQPTVHRRLSAARKMLFTHWEELIRK